MPGPPPNPSDLAPIIQEAIKQSGPSMTPLYVLAGFVTAAGGAMWDMVRRRDKRIEKAHALQIQILQDQLDEMRSMVGSLNKQIAEMIESFDEQKEKMTERLITAVLASNEAVKMAERSSSSLVEMMRAVHQRINDLWVEVKGMTHNRGGH